MLNSNSEIFIWLNPVFFSCPIFEIRLIGFEFNFLLNIILFFILKLLILILKHPLFVFPSRTTIYNIDLKILYAKIQTIFTKSDM